MRDCRSPPQRMLYAGGDRLLENNTDKQHSTYNGSDNNGSNSRRVRLNPHDYHDVDDTGALVCEALKQVSNVPASVENRFRPTIWESKTSEQKVLGTVIIASAAVLQSITKVTTIFLRCVHARSLWTPFRNAGDKVVLLYSFFCLIACYGFVPFYYMGSLDAVTMLKLYIKHYIIFTLSTNTISFLSFHVTNTIQNCIKRRYNYNVLLGIQTLISSPRTEVLSHTCLQGLTI